MNKVKHFQNLNLKLGQSIPVNDNHEGEEIQFKRGKFYLFHHQVEVSRDLRVAELRSCFDEIKKNQAEKQILEKQVATVETIITNIRNRWRFGIKLPDSLLSLLSEDFYINTTNLMVTKCHIDFLNQRIAELHERFQFCFQGLEQDQEAGQIASAISEPIERKRTVQRYDQGKK